MDLLSKLMRLPSLTIAATLESFLVIRFIPPFYLPKSHLIIVATILSINYGIFLLFWVLVYPKFISPLRHLPGPKSIISVSNRTLLETKRPPGDLFLDLVKEYPGEEILSISPIQKQILIMRPRHLADLLVHRAYDFIKPTTVSGFLRNVLGDGLVIVEGDQHKFLRKNTMPAFHFRHIKNLYPMMWDLAVAFTSAIDSEAFGSGLAGDESKKDPSPVIELSTWASRVTLDIIGIAGLGRKFNMLQKSEDPLLHIYEELLEPKLEKLAFALSSIVFGRELVRLLPWKMNSRFENLGKSLNDICNPMIREKREAIVKNGDDHFDILSLLIKSNNFSDSELKDQLLTFLAAGHETTASSITWTCYLLAKYPEVQAKLHEEIRSIISPTESLESFGEKNDDLAGALEQLPYLNGVINETLRLYPTVPMTMRQAIRDTRLLDQPIPQGTVVILSIWLMNRSPEVWGPDADQFRPERWISENGKPNQNGGVSSNYEFLTFLHGPRSCIGQNFAKAEMRCLMAAMLASFSWDLAMDESKVLPRGVITIKPADGLYLRLRRLKE